MQEKADTATDLMALFVTTKTESVPDVSSESSFSGILFTNHHFLEKEHSEEAKRACQWCWSQGGQRQNSPMGGDIYDDSAENIWNIFWEDLMEIISLYDFNNLGS